MIDGVDSRSMLHQLVYAVEIRRSRHGEPTRLDQWRIAQLVHAGSNVGALPQQVPYDGSMPLFHGQLQQCALAAGASVH